MAVGPGRGAVPATEWGKWNINTEMTTAERSAKRPEDAPSLESLWKLRLMALLGDNMVDDGGEAEVGKKLGIDSKGL